VFRTGQHRVDDGNAVLTHNNSDFEELAVSAGTDQDHKSRILWP